MITATPLYSHQYSFGSHIALYERPMTCDATTLFDNGACTVLKARTNDSNLVRRKCSSYILNVYHSPAKIIAGAQEPATAGAKHIEPGCVSFMPADTDQIYRLTGGIDLGVFLIDPTVVQNVAKSLGLNIFMGLGAFELKSDPLVSSIWDQFYAQHQSLGEVEPTYGESLFQTLVLHLLQKSHDCNFGIARIDSGRLPDFTIQEIDAYIEQTMGDKLSLQRLAQIANFSPFHFSRLFKATTGLTPHQYLTNRRLDRSVHMLMTTDLTIGEIARSVGLINQSHLSKHLRRKYGLTPGQIRMKADQAV